MKCPKCDGNPIIRIEKDQPIKFITSICDEKSFIENKYPPRYLDYELCDFCYGKKELDWIETIIGVDELWQDIDGMWKKYEVS